MKKIELLRKIKNKFEEYKMRQDFKKIDMDVFGEDGFYDLIVSGYDENNNYKIESYKVIAYTDNDYDSKKVHTKKNNRI